MDEQLVTPPPRADTPDATSPARQARMLFKAMRPRQWSKNLFIYAALVFDAKLSDIPLFLKPTAGFLIFCLLSSAVYLMNDLADVEKDRLHPEKCKRPIPAGLLPVWGAKSAMIIILTVSLLVSFALPSLFVASALAYFLLNILYSFALKHMVILDVLTIAIGFVLRAQAGVGTVQAVDPTVVMSNWLLLCTLMLALFLALAKRRQEIRKLKEDAAHHRRILREYSQHFIDEMTGIVAATTLVSYALYTVSNDTIAKFGTDKLVYTVPFVLYGIFRYLYLVHIRDTGDNPSEILLSDRPLQVNLILWVVTVIGIINFPR